jgi:hypothetical protein
MWRSTSLLARSTIPFSSWLYAVDFSRDNSTSLLSSLITGLRTVCRCRTVGFSDSKRLEVMYDGFGGCICSAVRGRKKLNVSRNSLS